MIGGKQKISMNDRSLLFQVRTVMAGVKKR